MTDTKKNDKILLKEGVISMNEINFTNCKEMICEYGGSEKKKKIEKEPEKQTKNQGKKNGI